MQFEAAAERKVQVINMKMNEVECFLALEDLFEKERVIDVGVDALAVEAQGAGGNSDQLRLGDGVTAGEERDFMPGLDELLGEKGNHPFGSAVEARGDTLVKRCNLGDLQNSPLSDAQGPRLAPGK